MDLVGGDIFQLCEINSVVEGLALLSSALFLGIQGYKQVDFIDDIFQGLSLLFKSLEEVNQAN